jgi:DNA-directed RNA polymerase alpha subunit
MVAQDLGLSFFSKLQASFMDDNCTVTLGSMLRRILYLI